MTPNSFTPSMFISIGATGAMFTLRQRYLDSTTTMTSHYGNVSYSTRYFISDSHVQNLGTTVDVAFPKAEQLARTAGLRLTSTREGLADELREIHRSTPEEVAERLQHQRVESASRNAAWAAQLDWYTVERMTKYPLWTFGFGQYKGKTVAEVADFDRGYLDWIADESQEPTLFQLMIITWLENHPVVHQESQYVGAVKERIEITGQVNKRFPLPNSEWGSDLIKITGDAGNVYVTFYSGHAWDPEVGDRVHIKATIKQHDTRDGVKQTIVGRVTEVK